MLSMVLGAAIMAWQNLRVHKLRTCLTCLSLTLAVMALVVVDASSQVASVAVEAQSRLSQGIAETWSVSPQYAPDFTAKAQRAQGIAEAMLAPNDGTAVLIAVGQGQIGGVHVAVVAMDGDLRRIRPFRIGSGVWLPLGDPERSPAVVLGGGSGSAIGLGPQTLSVMGIENPVTARVVGTVDDDAGQPTVYVGLEDLLLWSDTSPGSWSFEFLGHSDISRPGEAHSVLAYALRSVDLPSAEPTRTDSLGNSADALATVRFAFLAVATVALIIGALGILNIGLVSLNERVEEFALRRAVGAVATQIGLSVIMESVFASLIAAFVAVILASLCLPLLAETLYVGLPTSADISFPYQTAALGTAASAMAGLSGAIVPAIRAARISIATVMRA
jgi:hypothetical protein